MFLLPAISNAAVSYSESINLSPGWNIVSTPRVLDSHSFSLPETSDNFDVFVLNASSTAGWSTLADLGQTEFTPLFGYFINNKSTSTQTLTFNFEASTTPNQRFFTRNFSTTGWYSIGVANSTYSKTVTNDTSDTNNPSEVLNSLAGDYDSVIDLTDGNFTQDTNNVSASDTWKEAIASDINSLNDFRDNKGYAIYISQPNAQYSGFQNNDVPQPSVSITANGQTTSASVYASSSVSVAWTSTNTSSCIVTPGNFSGTSGAQNITISTSTTYSVDCSGLFGGEATSSVVINTVSGQVNVTLDTSLSSGNVVTGASNVPLARYTFKAYGEDEKISYLNVASNQVLDNVALYANGVQIGSTQTISALPTGVTSGTSISGVTSSNTSLKLFNLGSSLIIPAGTSVTVEVRGDIKYNGTNASTTFVGNATTTGNSIQVAVVGYSNNSQGSFSQQLITVPSTFPGSVTMTVTGAGVTLAKNSSFSDGSNVPNTVNQKLGSYILTTSSAEPVKITSLTVGLGGPAGAITNISNLYVAPAGQTATTPINPQSSNNFNVNLTIAPNSSEVIDVYGDFGSVN